MGVKLDSTSGGTWGTITGTLADQTDLAAALGAGVADGDKGDVTVSASGATWTVDALSSLVVGPASATDNAVVRYDGTTGKLVQNSVVTIADTTGNVGGVGNLTATSITVNGATDAVQVAVRGTAGQTADVFEVQTSAAAELFAVQADGSTNIPTNATYKINGTAHTHAESTVTFTDITTNNASTTAHGYAPKATAPAAGLVNALAIANGETVYTNKALYDTTNPAALGTAGPGTAVVAARRDHVHAMPALGDLTNVGTATPTDKHVIIGDGDSFESRALVIADISDTSTATGANDDFLQKKSDVWTNRTPTQVTADLIAVVGDSGSGGTKGLVPAPAAGDAAANKFLKASGAWVTPAGSGDVVGPASSTDNAITRFDSTTGKLVQNSSATVDDNGGINIPTGQTYNINGSPHTHAAASDTVSGLVELAIASEVTTGTDTGRAITPDALAGSSIFGVKTIVVQLNGTTALTTSEKAYFRIPAALNGMNLVSVTGAVGTGAAGSSSSGTPTFTVKNVTDNNQMLSTSLTIDASEYTSATAATAAVINTSFDDVVTDDLIEVAVTTAGTGVTYATVTLGFQLP